MVAYVIFVTFLFFSKSAMGMSRLMEPPKPIYRFYNHRADMVEMILNTLVFAVGLALLIGKAYGLI